MMNHTTPASLRISVAAMDMYLFKRIITLLFIDLVLRT